MSDKYDMSGSFSKNPRKEKDSHPDIKGKCTINGQDLWIDGWRKQREDGSTWYSLSFKPREAQAAKPAPAAKPVEPDEEIPF